MHTSDGNTIVSSSNFVNNRRGFFSNNILGTVTTAYCYWGNSSGPYHPSQNPTGLGDSVTTFVNVDPWINTPTTDAPPIPAQNTTLTGSGNDFISLSWDASELGDLAGYKVYYDSDESGYPYANSVDVGDENSYTLSDLALEHYLSYSCYYG